MADHKLKIRLLDTRGFSLIELIVALSLTVIVIGLIGTFFVSNYFSFNDARDMDILLTDVGVVTKALEDTLRESKGVVEASRVETAFQSFTVMDSDGVTRITFSLSGTTLTQKKGDGEPVVLTSRASDFHVLPIQDLVLADPFYANESNNDFTVPETRGIEYSFTLTEGRMTREVVSQITFRNKD